VKSPQQTEARPATGLTLVGYLRLAGLVIATVGALAMGGGASARAATDLGTVDGTSYVGDTSSGTPPASAATDLPCPDDTRPVGAGFFVNPPNYIHDAYPADLLDPFGPGALESVRDQAWMASGPVPEIHGYGICRSGPLSYRFDEGTLPSTPRARKLTARCPDNRHILGGGASAGQGSVGAAYVSSSFPIDDGDRGNAPDDGWRARVYGSDQDDALAVAVCAKTVQRYRSDQGITQNDFGLPSCKTDEHLLAIGARISGDPSEAQFIHATPNDSVEDADDVPDDYAVVRGESTDPGEINKPMDMFWICG
jgi:hypothetical protein